MESNYCKTNISANDVHYCYCKQLGKDEKSVDGTKVPCMKSSKSGSNVSNQSTVDKFKAQKMYSRFSDFYSYIFFFSNFFVVTQLQIQAL